MAKTKRHNRQTRKSRHRKFKGGFTDSMLSVGVMVLNTTGVAIKRVIDGMLRKKGKVPEPSKVVFTLDELKEQMKILIDLQNSLLNETEKQELEEPRITLQNTIDYMENQKNVARREEIKKNDFVDTEKLHQTNLEERKTYWLPANVAARKKKYEEEEEEEAAKKLAAEAAASTNDTPKV